MTTNTLVTVTIQTDALTEAQVGPVTAWLQSAAMATPGVMLPSVVTMPVPYPDEQLEEDHVVVAVLTFKCVSPAANEEIQERLANTNMSIEYWVVSTRTE